MFTEKTIQRAVKLIDGLENESIDKEMLKESLHNADYVTVLPILKNLKMRHATVQDYCTICDKECIMFCDLMREKIVCYGCGERYVY